MQNSGLSPPLGSPKREEGLNIVQLRLVFLIACSDKCFACIYLDPFGLGLAPNALISMNLFTPNSSAIFATFSDPLNCNFSFVNPFFGNSLINAIK